ncbi:MAG: ABC transporter ATP-binding protein, partial [Anaerolineae bacterium]|nr:ABC transporter ATP-binding protein [Anaerolineae bacterium]
HNTLYLHEPMPVIVFPGKTTRDQLVKLEVKHLSFHYPSQNGNGSRPGIEDISFSVNLGDFVVVTGRVGSGKTTLLRVLLGLLPAQQVEIYWNDVRIEDPSTFFVPPRSAYTAQIPHLFSKSLRNNILLGLPESQTNLMRSVKRAVLQPDLRNLKDGLDTQIGVRGVKLSGGQRQRTAAARMFVREPELLVFDDLSSALDAETEQALWNGILEQAPGEKQTTCLVVSHRRQALLRADNILLLKNGHLAASGKLDELLETHEEMQQIWGT